MDEPTPSTPHRTIRKRFAALRGWRETDAGQSLTEFAMILPIMLVLLFGLVDFGRAFYSWLVITNAAREGARAGAVQQNSDAIRTRINESASGVSLSKLSITLSNVQGARGTPIVVDLSYDFDYVTPIGGILGLMGGSISEPTITAHASMRLE
ncbi:MAG: pilus assembly protein [Chloroflexi bacterium]|nr:pilus assembly protein [Chloroflexota bacterium]